VKTNLKCRNVDKPHIFFWSSSPYLPSKEYLVNHGLICSGILPSDYKCFANGAGIGIINEVASYEDLETIDIMTDARHGWRKNAKDT
jgi:hypothetical protein